MNEHPPVPWDHVPRDARWMTLDSDGQIDTWANKPVLMKNKYWFALNMGRDHISGFCVPDGGDHKAQIWERPATQYDQPPVPWSEVTDDAKWMTRDADGSVDAWDGKNRPVLWDNAVWDGEADDMMRLRWPDGDEHEPKIWERPE